MLDACQGRDGKIVRIRQGLAVDAKHKALRVDVFRATGHVTSRTVHLSAVPLCCVDELSVLPS